MRFLTKLSLLIALIVVMWLPWYYKWLTSSGFIDREKEDISSKQRKIFLDCGGNVASSVQLFKESYPDANEYEIHSFELDPKLRPYFKPYELQGSVTAHVPCGVSDKDGFLTAYLESVWYPGKTGFAERDQQWGGGSLLATDDEKQNNIKKGSRKLSRQITVPIIDLSKWIQTNTKKEDYVILKLDVQGSEYAIVDKMLADNTFEWIDKFYGEFHSYAAVGVAVEERTRIKDSVAARGIHQVLWEGETKHYADFDSLHEIRIPSNAPGQIHTLNNQCVKKEEQSQVSIIIEVGMNAKTARLLIETIHAYEKHVPLTLFVYGDFVELYPELIIEWSKVYEIGIRGSSPLPRNLWALQNYGIQRLSVVSAEMKLSKLGITTAYIFPPEFGETVTLIAKERSLRMINSTVTLPPRSGSLMLETYFKYEDVKRTPKALRIIHEELVHSGGILSLDSDFPDCQMTSIFLLDYLYDVSNHKITSLRECFGGK